jgi:hypothetical protein
MAAGRHYNSSQLNWFRRFQKMRVNCGQKKWASNVVATAPPFRRPRFRRFGCRAGKRRTHAGRPSSHIHSGRRDVQIATGPEGQLDAMA